MSNCSQKRRAEGSVTNSLLGRRKDGNDLFVNGSSEAKKNEVQNPLQMAHVIRHLFLYFGNQELLKCSVVCKMWNYEAKCILRDLRKCLVHLKVNHKLEWNLTIFYNTFSEPFGGMILFNGIRIESDDGHDMSRCDDCPGNNIKSFAKLGKDWTLKYIEIDWKDPDRDRNAVDDYDSSKNFYSCAKIIPALLFQHAATLQELTVRAPGSIQDTRYRSIGLLFGKDLRKLSLPSLKTFQLGPGTEATLCKSRFVQQMIHNVRPNIQILDVWLRSCDVIRYTRGKLSLFKRYVMKTDDESRGNEIFADACPKLNKLTIFSRAAENYNRTPWESVRKLLRSSSSSLRELRIDLGTAVQLYSHQGLPPLDNLQYFEIFYVAQEDLKSQNFLESMKLINFSRLFPALSTVHIKMVPRKDNEEAVDVMEPVVAEGGPVGDALNIRCLAFHGTLSIPEQAWNLSTLFPNVHTLHIRAAVGGFHGSLWTAWPDLQNILIGMHDEVFEDWDTNDAIFCGIHSEEADYLRGMSDEDLNRIQIVPVCPSICGLKNLRNFVVLPLNFVDSEDEEEEEDDDEDYMSPYLSSKVAAVLALRRMRNLNARLVINTGARLLNFFGTFKGDWERIMLHSGTVAVNTIIEEGANLKEVFRSDR